MYGVGEDPGEVGSFDIDKGEFGMASSLPRTDKITVAIITGGHAFDVPGFQAIFRDILEVDTYIQHLDNFVADVGGVRDQYDVLLFYHMPWQTPAEESKTRKVLKQLGTTGQGIFMLHHAILAYLEWPFWSELVGIQDRRFEYYHDQELHIEIANPSHPITQGLEAWGMIDETYKMADIGTFGSQPLLRVTHPQSMQTIAWTRKFKEARVFCFQSGHDNTTYVNPNFRTVILRGIQWCAGRI